MNKENNILTEKEKWEQELLTVKCEIREKKNKQLEKMRRSEWVIVFLTFIFSILSYHLGKNKGLNFWLNIFITLLVGFFTIVFGTLFIFFFTKRGKEVRKLCDEIDALQKEARRLITSLIRLENQERILNIVDNSTQRGIFCWDCRKEIPEKDCRESLKYCSACRNLLKNQ